MTPREWWLVYDMRVGDRQLGNTPESEVESLYQTLQEAVEKHG